MPFLIHSSCRTFKFTLPTYRPTFSEITDHKVKRSAVLIYAYIYQFLCPFEVLRSGSFNRRTLHKLEMCFTGPVPQFEPRARIAARTSAILTENIVVSLSPFRYIDGY